MPLGSSDRLGRRQPQLDDELAPSPCPSLRASRRPPWSSTSRRASARPMPSPGCAERVSPCVKRSNTRGNSSGDIPIPESITEIDSCGAASLVGGVIIAEIGTDPPRSVNFAALWSRFDRICMKRVGSTSTTQWSLGRSTLNSISFGRHDGAIGFHRAVDQAAEWRRLALEGDLARRDSRHVQQVVDQAHHVTDLTLHHLADSLDGRPRCRRRAESARGRCGWGRADFSARAPASPGTRLCARWRPATAVRRGPARSPPTSAPRFPSPVPLRLASRPAVRDRSRSGRRPAGRP